MLNDTRVIPARLRGWKATGGGIEVLLARELEPGPTPVWQVLARSLGGADSGARLSFGPRLAGEILSRGERGVANVRFFPEPGAALADLIDELGAVPLPPYIEAARKQRASASETTVNDRERYQTVYARAPGAIAAPTAGLHFTPALLDAIRAAGHEIATITLHVGPGTFRPVEGDDPAQHRIDSEAFDIPAHTAAAVEAARAEGRPIVAVGTTVVRTLEASATAGPVRAGAGVTDLFILPGRAFTVVTDLVTNFHLPRSTLLMLVAAFAGRDNVLAAYRDAVARGYRFYSYGDAMFISPAQAETGRSA